jgi:hypothetical protein
VLCAPGANAGCAPCGLCRRRVCVRGQCRAPVRLDVSGALPCAVCRKCVSDLVDERGVGGRKLDELCIVDEGLLSPGATIILPIRILYIKKMRAAYLHKIPRIGAPATGAPMRWLPARTCRSPLSTLDCIRFDNISVRAADQRAAVVGPAVSQVGQRFDEAAAWRVAAAWRRAAVGPTALDRDADCAARRARTEGGGELSGACGPAVQQPVLLVRGRGRLRAAVPAWEEGRRGAWIAPVYDTVLLHDARLPAEQLLAGCEVPSGAACRRRCCCRGC